jgi:alpha-mannosidase
MDDAIPAPEPAEARSEPTPGPVPLTRPWKLIALIRNDGKEPSGVPDDREALAAWSVISALWHPALLARVEALPRIEDVESPAPPSRGDILVLAVGAAARLPSGYQTQAEDAGALVLAGDTDRLTLVREVLDRIEPGATLGPPEGETVARDFLALGAARWWLRDLTLGMGHVDSLDVESLTREVLAGARAWQNGDWPAATNRLRAAFELLTQARERFYPVDAYILDLCLLDPATPADTLAPALAARVPVSFLGPAVAIAALAQRRPDLLQQIRDAVTAGWADVVGGAYAEVEEPLLPLESVFWQFRKGGQTYQEHLDDRSVETLARRRFGLYPLLPTIAKRFGFRFALHLGFDEGRFPVRPEAKRLWEGPDGSSLEALTRPPLAADRFGPALQLAWRLARTMKDDHVATLPLAHWPEPVVGWYLDLRRVAAYSPVLARWTTLSDYFHLTDRPYELFRAELDDYASPYLAQAVARRDAEPISHLARHARLRARLDGIVWLRAVAAALSAPAPEFSQGEPDLSAVEDTLETGRQAEAETLLDRQEPAWARALARGVVGPGTSGRPGYLVLNPLGVARRAAVLLPDAALDLRPAGSLRAAQLAEEGVWAVVELPAHGYAWVPRESLPSTTPAPLGMIAVQKQTLFNESMAVEIDASTGGIRSLRAAGETGPRLGQQLVMTGLVGPDGKPAHSRMKCDRFEVDYGGPALVQVVTQGGLLDPRDGRPLARFHQRYRLWTGRPLLELEITLSDLDPAWLTGAERSDPWRHFLSCRWAWADPGAMLRRTHLYWPELTEAERPETPDVLDFSTRRQRTALLFGGLPYHQRHGPRMLDTLLIAGRETARSFRLGVALDLEYPFHAALDLIGPAFVVPTDAGPPRTGPVGWFFQLDNKAVAVTRVDVRAQTAGASGRVLVFHLFETTGRSARCRLRLFRDPSWARQTDFHGDLIVDLTVEGDTVQIDLTPHELARVEVTLD